MEEDERGGVRQKRRGNTWEREGERKREFSVRISSCSFRNQ